MIYSHIKPWLKYFAKSKSKPSFSFFAVYLFLSPVFPLDSLNKVKVMFSISLVLLNASQYFHGILPGVNIEACIFT